MYKFSDFDAKGYLKAPLLFWAVLLLQGRSWVLLVAAGVSKQQGNELLVWFYPDHDQFILGLLSGIPAALTFLISGRRYHWPKTWYAFYYLLILTQITLLIMQGVNIATGWDVLSFYSIILLVIDIYALIWLLRQRRLKDYFALEQI